MFESVHGHVRGEMIDAVDGFVECEAECLGGGNADEACAYQALQKVLGPQPPLASANPPAAAGGGQGGGRQGGRGGQ